MAPSDDPLDDPGDGLPASPTRRRFALVAGLVMILLILVALVWFVAENTSQPEERGGILGWREAPGAVPAAG